MGLRQRTGPLLLAGFPVVEDATGWAPLLFPGEQCSEMSFWLGTAGSPAPQAAAGGGP